MNGPKFTKLIGWQPLLIKRISMLKSLTVFLSAWLATTVALAPQADATEARTRPNHSVQPDTLSDISGLLSVAGVHKTVELTKAAICVRNGTKNTYLFTAEARNASREIETLVPGGQLCVFGAKSGVVSVFESQDAQEGCSRLATLDREEILLGYFEFDRCRWRSNSG